MSLDSRPRPETTPAPAGDRAPVTYVVRREDDFPFDSVEYADLHRRAGSPPFQHGAWLSELYDVLAPRRRARKVVVTVRDAHDGRLVLVLPLVGLRRGMLRVLEYANLGVSDYAVPVVDPRDVADLLGDQALVRQIRESLGPFDLLQIAHVPDVPDTFLALLAGARASRHSYSAHTVDLAATVELWRSSLDPSFARHLERKFKRLRPRGEHRLRLVDDPSELESLMRRMQRFRAARFAERGGMDLVQDPDCFAFYVAAIRRSLTAGLGRLAAFEVAGEPAAVVFDLVDESTELFVLVGYDFERLRNASLGLLVVTELAGAAIVRNLRHFDLTVGDEAYKADFGARPRPLYEVRVCRTPLGSAGAVSRDTYLAARRVAKRVVSSRRDRRARRQSA